MTKNQDIANLLSFCIEQYKNAKHLSGGTAMEVLNGYGVLEYVQHNDHSYQWLMVNTDAYVF